MATTRWDSQLVPKDSTQSVGKAFIPITAFWGACSAASTTLNGLGDGAPVTSAELNASGIAGMMLGADADEFDCLWQIPQDCDLTALIQFNLLLHWGSASATGDAIDMALTYNAITPDNATSGLIADAATTTGVTNPTNGTITWVADNAITKATSVFKIGANTLTSNAQYLHLQFTVVDLDSAETGPSADEVSIIGCEVTYTRRFV